MHIDFHQSDPPAGPRLVLRGVTVEAQPPYDVGLDDVSFTLQGGDLLLVQLEHGAEEHPLADVISGLVPLSAGELEIFGGKWPAWSADQQARARWRIGRVFEGAGWLSNLDVDENVTLAERHHTHRAIPDIDDEVRELARLAGLDEVPRTRPPVTGREDLRRAEWVRAALGSPWLVLLERPGLSLADGWQNDLKPIIARLRKRGVAIIWLTDDSETWRDDSLNPSLKLRAQENKLVPVQSL
jgi:ABC-type ATPase involved in cell division